jgi:hypothetical protein
MADEKKNTGYVSPWQDQIKEIANKIINREKFSYDLNGDALYKQYKDRYMSQGKQAMMDTMGQAAALTGGYGNSYAQSVGQQTYQGYLQGLNDQIPTLYQIALDKYTAEGNQMRDNLGVMMQQDDIGYGRYRDQIADDQWQKEFNEDLRRWNLQWAARNATESSGGGGGVRRYTEDPDLLDTDPPLDPPVTATADVGTRDGQNQLTKQTNAEINKAYQAGKITAEEAAQLRRESNPRGYTK